MTASEVRDRLDQRFRLLVGSRRGLSRHHTLRHAVAWSYDLLDDIGTDATRFFMLMRSHDTPIDIDRNGGRLS